MECTKIIGTEFLSLGPQEVAALFCAQVFRGLSRFVRHGSIRFFKRPYCVQAGLQRVLQYLIFKIACWERMSPPLHFWGYDVIASLVSGNGRAYV